MIIATTETIANHEIEETLGVVKGETIRARWFGRDIAAGLRQVVGGEIKSYTDMMMKAREEAIERMVEEAKKLGADAVIGVRFSTAMVMQGASEVMAYGTAVKLKA
jgi:uncharacterized protein YbjQ (UPF0145 family)